jgi:competence protein ComEA
MKRLLGLAITLVLAAPVSAEEKPAAAPAPATAPAATAPAATATAPAAKPPAKAKIMDINTATADELKTLPGITDDIAGKIIAGRPYTGKDQLLKQNIVDKDEYAKLRPLIVAKQPKQPKAPAAAAPPPAEKK